MSLADLPHVLSARADIWRGDQTPPAISAVNDGGLSSGFAELDALLPGSGWPRGALTEIILPHEGVGALSLLMPALAKLSRARRWLAWVSPPHIPYAPALAYAGIDLSRVLLVRPKARTDGLWALEQTLRAGTCGAVMAWPAANLTTTQLRRLQLAAEEGNTWGILFRVGRTAEQQASPAALRLRLEATDRGLAVHVLKRRGAWAAGPVHLDIGRALVMHASSPTAIGSVQPGRGLS